jgi:hypothetical protein
MNRMIIFYHSYQRYHGFEKRIIPVFFYLRVRSRTFLFLEQKEVMIIRRFSYIHAN